MALTQKTIGNASYYTDGLSYYSFHVINSTNDSLWKFAAQDLGINKTSGFTPDESTRINDLAGTGMYQHTKYMLLKDGQAVQIPYNLTVPILHPGDIILRKVPSPSTGLVLCPHCASKVLPGPTCSACGRPLTP